MQGVESPTMHSTSGVLMVQLHVHSVSLGLARSGETQTSHVVTGNLVSRIRKVSVHRTIE